MKRHSVHKGRAAHAFRQGVTRTKMINVAPKPMRGGYRL